QDFTAWAKQTEFRIFQQADKVKGIVAPDCGRYSRKDLDLLEAKAKEFGAAGLIWVKKAAESFQSSILKAVGEEKIRQLWTNLGGKDSDLVVMVAGSRSQANSALGQLRLHLARQEKWYGRDDFAFEWVVDFPLFEFDSEENRYVACHHPFTSP